MSATSHYDKGRAWLILFASASINILLSSLFMVGVFNLTFLEVFREGKSLTAWCPAIMSSLLSLAGPIGGLIAKRFSCRVGVMVGSLLSCFGLFVSSFAPNFPFLFVSFGFITGLGFGIAYTPAIVILGFYFKKYLDIVSGIVTSMVGIGAIFFPPLFQYLLDIYSWRGAIMLYGGICLQVCIFGALLKPSPNESPTSRVTSKRYGGKHSIQFNEYEKTDIADGKKDNIQGHNCDITSCNLLTNRRFVMFCVCYFTACSGVSSIYMHFQAYAFLSGIERHDTNLFATIMGVGVILGRFSSGFIIYFCNISSIALYVVYTIIAGFVTVALPFYATEYTGFLIYSVIFGYFGNVYQTFCGTLTQKFVGVENLAVAYGILLMIGGFSYLLSPPLTGWMYDISLSYSYAYYFSGTCLFLSAISAALCWDCSFASKLTKDRKDRKYMIVSMDGKPGERL